jgi:hypothetical protein
MALQLPDHLIGVEVLVWLITQWLNAIGLQHVAFKLVP